jgi:hypothetical protein
MVQAIGINRQGNRAKAGKAFFFEKKKQKTLDPSVSLPIGHTCNDQKFQKQKFFGSRRAGAAFFSKKNCFLPSPHYSVIAKVVGGRAFALAHLRPSAREEAIKITTKARRTRRNARSHSFFVTPSCSSCLRG